MILVSWGTSGGLLGAVGRHSFQGSPASVLESRLGGIAEPRANVHSLVLMLACWGGVDVRQKCETSIATKGKKMHVNQEVETEKWMENFKMLNATSNKFIR